MRQKKDYSETKSFTINNFKAGEFDVYLDWSTPNELGIYVDRPLSDMQTEQFASAIIDLETGEVN